MSVIGRGDFDLAEAETALALPAESVEEEARQDERFHSLLAQASGNRFWIELMDALGDVYRTWIEAVLRGRGRRAAPKAARRARRDPRRLAAEGCGSLHGGGQRALRSDRPRASAAGGAGGIAEHSRGVLFWRLGGEKPCGRPARYSLIRA